MDFSVLGKAKSAIQAAAAKAETVYTEIKADIAGNFKRSSSNLPQTPEHLPGEGDLPWIGKSEHEKKHEAEFRDRILQISKRPEVYLLKHYDEALLVDMRAAMSSAGAVLEEDENLRHLRFQLVPKKMKEHEFWRRYFIAVKRIKQEILARDSEGQSDNREGESALGGRPESPRKDPAEEAEYELAFQAVAIPPSMVLRRLAFAIRIGRPVPSMVDLTVVESEPLPESHLGDKLADFMESSISKIGALAKKGRKKKQAGQRVSTPPAQLSQPTTTSGLGEYHALLWSLFDADIVYNDDESLDNLEQSQHQQLAQRTRVHRTPGIVEEINGAPPDSFVAQLAEIMAGISTEQKMAMFWLEAVKQLRRQWQGGIPVPRMPVEANPNLRMCLLHQQLQLLNTCIARRSRRQDAIIALDAMAKDPVPEGLLLPGELGQAVSASTVADGRADSSDSKVSGAGTLGLEQGAGLEAVGEKVQGGGEALQPEAASGKVQPLNSPIWARLKDGSVARRMGADVVIPGMKLLDTGEDLYSPVSQDAPVLTEIFIRETEELILKTGSVGAGCSQLYSDMQAFKAANPGCLLEDFVRWYSPLDWAANPRSPAPGAPEFDVEEGGGEEETDGFVDVVAKRPHGYLSTRMKAAARDLRGMTQGNLWQELWSSARAIPAMKQAPLFDEELAGESTLEALEAIAPSDLFEQLFITALGAGFSLAKASPQVQHNPLKSALEECLPLAISTCTRGMSSGKLDRLCQVYETMETAVHSPPSAVPPPSVPVPADVEQLRGEAAPQGGPLAGVREGLDTSDLEGIISQLKFEEESPTNEKYFELRQGKPTTGTVAPEAAPTLPVKSSADAENDWTIL